MSIKIVAVVLVGALLAACGKDNPSTAVAGADERSTDQAEAANPQSKLPQPDNRPISAYTETNSGKQLAYQYYAARAEPVDYMALAKGAMWDDFRRTTDQFAQQDLVEKYKPELEKGVADAKANPYHWVVVGTQDNLFGAYDFQRKGFPILEFSQVGQRGFTDTPSYQVRWSNASQVAFAPVADETAAREIEAYRTQSKPFRLGVSPYPLLKIYYFVQSTTPRENEFKADTVNAAVVRVQITDPEGKVLAEYTPDGSVLVSAPEAGGECQGDAAACAGKALGI